MHLVTGTTVLNSLPDQLLTPNNLGGTWRHICLPDIRSISALEVLLNRALQMDIYLFTILYYLTLHYINYHIITKLINS